MTHSIPDLIARLEASVGSDRSLDADIAEAFGLVPEGYVRATSHGTPKVFLTFHRPELPYSEWHCPYFTTSLDAVNALAKQALPGWEWSTLTFLHGEVTAGICQRVKPYGCEYGKHKQELLARLAAVIKAKIEELKGTIDG